MRGSSRNSPQKVHRNFAQNLGGQIFGNTFSGLKQRQYRQQLLYNRPPSPFMLTSFGGSGAPDPRSSSVDRFPSQGISEPPGIRELRLTIPVVRGFEKGLAGGGWRLTTPKNTAKKFSRNVFPLLLRGHRRKGAEKRPHSLAKEGFVRANPLCPPTPFRNF